MEDESEFNCSNMPPPPPHFPISPPPHFSTSPFPHVMYFRVVSAWFQKISHVYIHLALLFVCRVSPVPKYLPDAQGVRNPIIESYFLLGFQYSEILAFLSALHGVSLSLRQLKRVLHSRGFQRRRVRSSQDILDVIDQELSRIGSCFGYRQMHQRLRVSTV